jgi:hypothetical protein
MSDQIVVEYVGKVDKLQTDLRKIEQEQIAIDKQAKKTGTTITNESNKSATAVKGVSKNVSGLKDAFNTLSNNLPFAGAIQQVTQLGSSVVSATGGVSQMGVSWKALDVIFKRSVIGLIITAVVALITAVTTFFRVTEKGGDKLERIMQVINVIVGEVVKVFAKLGEIAVDAIEGLYEPLVKVYEFMVNKFFKAIELISGALETLGFNDTAKSLEKFKEDLKKSKSENELYIDSLVKMGKAIADLADEIEDLGISISLQNSKLQTDIDTNLKALRNQTNTYKENLGLIDKISKAEEKKLSNSTGLIDKEIELERKKFITNANNQVKATFLFDQFVEGQINAQELIAEVDGKNTSKTVKNITDVLIKREDATRESMVLEERLNNFRDANAQKEKGRVEKEFQDKLKLIGIREKLALGIAKIEGRDQGNLIAIEEGFNKKRIELFEEFGRDKTTEYEELLLGQKALEKGYTDFLQKEDDRRIADAKEISDKEFKEKQIELAKEKDEEIRVATEIRSELDQIARDELKKIQDNAAKEKAIKIQALQETIDISSQLLNGFNDLKLAKVNTEVSNERAANDEQTQSLLDNLEKRKEAGLLTDQQVAAKKAQIQKGAAIKEAKLKEKLWKAEQNAQLTRIAIDAAVGVAKTVATYLSNPLTAVGTPIVIASILASAAVQAAFVKAQPMPKFKDGVIDLQGQGTGTSDSITARLSRGESVMTAKETSQYRPLFQSIRDGKFENYAYENIARPAMKREAERQRKKEGMAENLLKAINLNNLDTSHLERLTKSNKNVKIANAKEIADELAKVVTPKPNRGL